MTRFTTFRQDLPVPPTPRVVEAQPFILLDTSKPRNRKTYYKAQDRRLFPDNDCGMQKCLKAAAQSGKEENRYDLEKIPSGDPDCNTHAFLYGIYVFLFERLELQQI